MTQPLIIDDQLDSISGSKVTGNISGNAANVTGIVAISKGGTGESNALDAINALLPSQTGNNGKFLTTDGTDPSWVTVAGSGTVTSVAMSVPSFLSVAGSPITTAGTLAVTLSGTALPVANGGTGLTTLTADNVILGAGTSTPTFVAPGTTGNVLTSNGTTWTSSAPAAGGSVYYKDPVRGATTANLASLSGNLSIDGLTSAAGERWLVKNQTTASQNGIYVASAGAWTRATDFDTTGAEVSNGVIVPVQAGTINGGSTWQLVQNGGAIGNSFRFAPVNGVMVGGIASGTTPSIANFSGVAIGAGASCGGNASIAIGNGATTGSGSTSSIAIGTSAGTGFGITVLNIGGTPGGSTSTTIRGTGAGEATVCLGSNSTISASNNYAAIAIGNRSYSEMNCEFTISGGSFSSTADMKSSIIPSWTTTTSATPVEVGQLTSGNASTAPTGRIILTNDSSYIFDCDIVARNTATDTETAGWNLKFVIRRGAAAANTAIVGSATKTVLAQDTGTTTWDVGVTADTTNGRPKIEVTGEAAKTIRWVCNIRMTKVSG